MKLKKLLTLSLAGALLIGGVVTTNAAELDLAWYAAKNPDVVAELGNSPEALKLHYEMYGRKEGRAANDHDVEAQLRRLFKAEEYAALYPDVKAAFGEDEEALFQHYIGYGLLEARRPAEKVSQAAAVTLKTTVEKALADAGVAAAPGSAQLVEIITDTIPADAGGAAVQAALVQAAPEVKKAVAAVVEETANPAPANGGGSSSSSSSSSSGGSSTTTPPVEDPVEESVKDAVWAPLVDHVEDGGVQTELDAINTTMANGVTTTKDGVDKKLAVVTFEEMSEDNAIPKHNNSQKKNAYWFGIGVPYKGDGYTYYWDFANDEADAKDKVSDEKIDSLSSKANTDVDGENVTFYWGGNTSNTKITKWGYLVVKEGDDVVAKYIVNFRGLTLEQKTE